MEIFNKSQTYPISNKKNLNQLERKENQSQFIRKVKNVKNSPITMIKNCIKSLFSGAEKVKKNSLRDNVMNSKVVPDSTAAAKESFMNTSRFNGIRADTTSREEIELSQDKTRVSNGDIMSLIGKGIISNKTENDHFPVKYDYVRNDRETDVLNKGTSNINYGIKCYNGDKIKSAEIIPGTPIGNYYNKQVFNQNLKIIQLDNGNCGTIGLKFDITKLTPDMPLLIHSGELSGCTTVYGLKDNFFYAFHSGQPGNDKSVWETETDGSKSIIDSHKKMMGSTVNIDNHADNKILSDYLSENFDSAMMAFCGHGESVISKSNVTSFDYNKSSNAIEGDKSRVANTMAMLINKDGKIKINMFSDDMTIDNKTLQTESVDMKVLNIGI